MSKHCLFSRIVFLISDIVGRESSLIFTFFDKNVRHAFGILALTKSRFGKNQELRGFDSRLTICTCIMVICVANLKDMLSCHLAYLIISVHCRTNEIALVRSKDSDQSGHLPSLI